MPKYTRRHTRRNNKSTRKHRRHRRQKTKVKTIENPSGISHLYTSVYGPRGSKGGIVQVEL